MKKIDPAKHNQGTRSKKGFTRTKFSYPNRKIFPALNFFTHSFILIYIGSLSIQPIWYKKKLKMENKNH